MQAEEVFIIKKYKITTYDKNSRYQIFKNSNTKKVKGP
jgi:hypothetical protein